MIASLALSACGGGGGDSDTGDAVPPVPVPGIGSSGGTVNGPNGARVVIPAGALAANTQIAIAQSSAGAPALPTTITPAGAMFAFTPHGTTFATPVAVTIPFDPSLVPSGAAPVLFKTNANNEWEQVASATVAGTTLQANVSSFSFFQAAPPPVVRNDPTRVWTFYIDNLTLEEGSQVGGELREVRDFGRNVFDLDDGKQTMEVFSSADGVTYWVNAEDRGFAGLVQSQSFIKTETGATLEFVITAATLEAADFNLAPFASECPNGPSIAMCTPMHAHVQFIIQAFDTNRRLLLDFDDVPLLNSEGFIELEGHTTNWLVGTDIFPINRTSQLWTRANFIFTGDGTRLPKIALTSPIVIRVDLTSVGVGEEFFVESSIAAVAGSRGRESSIGAYFRDPARVGGATMRTSGLRPTNLPPPPRSPQGPAEPLPCPAANPAAGSLQFDAAAYSRVEQSFGGMTGIQITRTGGTSGAVSATVTAGGGTATPDVHYKPVASTVTFADGDSTPRTLQVELINNALREPDTTVNLQLSQPGGCAVLGANASAVLTILDDDREPPPPPPRGLDLTFSGDGKAVSPAFGGDRSAMAMQADGKFVIVGGTFTDFVLARFNADGTLDTTFDGDGKVTTDMVASEQEEAMSVAIQADGKIVVAGYTGTPGAGGPATFALTRYNANGSLDTSFGIGGRITSGVIGLGYAIAIQSDGKIIVAGEVPVSRGNDFADFVIARFNTDGTPDTSFSGDGQVITDIASGTNTARNILLQSNGAIVVSGEPFGSFAGSDHTDIVRYTSNGIIDTTFASTGAVTLPQRVGEGLALQSDGQLVLTGTIDASVPPAPSGSVTEFAVMRVNASGAVDNSFGTAGIARIGITGQRDAARAIALQPDGKIVVAGQSSNTNVNFAVARFDANGQVDTTFGNGTGRTTIDFFGFSDIAESIVIQPDGKLVVGGLARDNADGYGLARIVP